MSNGLSRVKTVLGIAIATLTLAAMTLAAGRAVATQVWGLETEEAHRTDIERIERKLDCALFDLPRHCRETMSPRGMP